MIAYLNYGVLGLCAIMLILVARLLRAEQAREKPRREITRLASLYMGFALVLAVLNGYVQLQNRPGNPELAAQAKADQEQYRRAKAAMDILQAQLNIALDAKTGWIAELPPGSSVRKNLQDFDATLRKAAAEAVAATTPRP